jgi:anaerobic ribonucleoside-triphosphate reductase activating protein
MNYGKIESCSVVSGPGCRVSVFVSGCEHRCKNCFNPETWNFEFGKEFTEDTLNSILKLAEPKYISGISLLGGDPMHPRNREEILRLVRKFKEKYPDKTVWLWTGYLLEDVFEDLVDSGIDVVVDGRFVEELKDLRLKYRGSSNQRVVDLKETIRTGEITLYK